ncbi:hypothetical protein BFJ70_g17089 [Fusarium oxysporum]|nr:hypothetical protein BFJ70_g17089 [Fusarium oxysporum]
MASRSIVKDSSSNSTFHRSPIWQIGYSGYTHMSDLTLGMHYAVTATIF